ncbi:MAG: PQQ-binding-like beta-propeller repeat protein, partial [Spirochaetia bacterium]
MRNLRSRAILLGLIVVGSVSGAAQEWLYVSRSGAYAVINPADGAIVSAGELLADGFQPEPSSVPEIVPTPGGRYVFFVYAQQDKAIVVDAETHLVAWAADLPRNAETIQFSSIGDRLYVLRSDGSRVVLEHRQGEVSETRSDAPALDVGRIGFNRRATRLYGNDGRNLVYSLASTGELVRTVPLRGGPYDWSVSPNFRFLLGRSRTDGRLVLIDEQRARAVAYADVGEVAGEPLFDAGSGSVYVLTDSGSRITVLDTRRFREQRTESLPFALSTLYLGEGERYHGVSADRLSVV